MTILWFLIGISSLSDAADAFGNPMQALQCRRISTDLSSSTAQGQIHQKLENCDVVQVYQLKYLKRIGFSREEADEMVSSSSSNTSSMEDLQKLLTKHLMSVPFENMDQHEHPSHGDTPLIPRRSNESLPSLDIVKCLDKIVNRNRGGFCFEVNLAFNWLLSSLGYNTRLALADVSCQQLVPGHVLILVDNLMKDSGIPILVDVGFGSPGVCDVILPIQCNAPKEDCHGDLFEFRSDNETDRFDIALYRTRVNDPDGKGPMYRFHIDDDIEVTASELLAGLDHVLNISPTFNEKRICVMSNTRGHIALGKDCVKWVEKGENVRQIELPTETDWRAALKEHFGITLIP